MQVSESLKNNQINYEEENRILKEEIKKLKEKEINSKLFALTEKKKMNKHNKKLII